MTDRVMSAAESVARLASEIARLEDELRERRARLPAAKAEALARPVPCRIAAGAEGRLLRLRERLRRAEQQAENAAMAARRTTAKRQRAQQAVAALTRRLDALKADAPEVDRRWRRERAAEARQIARLKARIAERQGTPDADEKRVFDPSQSWDDILPRPVAQPLDDGAAPTAPPRPGLLPGEFSLLDPARTSLLDAAPLPSRWTARHVGARLIEAHQILRRLPIAIAPRRMTSMWPAFQRPVPDENDLPEGEVAAARLLRSATPDQLSRMDEALSWPIEILAARPSWMIADLSRWAERAVDPDADRPPHETLAAIADALNIKKRLVR